MTHAWKVQDSAELYHIPSWGAPYFGVNELGHVVVRPRPETSTAEIDLKLLVDDLRRRGIEPPLLIRLNDLLGARLAEIGDAFRASIREYGYQGAYRPVMPIKVNQQRHVVEELVRRGSAYKLGLEAGSKPEILVAIALLDHGGVLVCNGYKDEEYIDTVLHAQVLGRQPVLVLDRFAELDLIIRCARRLGVRPNIGMRMKLSSRGAGKWEESSGDGSKFGLSTSEVVHTVDRLREEGMLDCVKLLHFHIGSQITAIRSVKEAIREASRVYTDLRRLGCESLQLLDVGGGLAVDYDGSKTNFPSSRNYSIQEYANDIVATIQSCCDETDQPHPTIITESGRALVAHHAVLVFNVLGTHERGQDSNIELPKPSDDDHVILHGMWDAYSSVSKKNFQESYNDVVALKEESATLFSHGVIDLRARARIEDFYWATLGRIQKTIRQLDYVPDDLAGLQKRLCDTYFCNFSVFQSLPDTWAVDQLFPILPIHRLEEKPTRDATLADLTCDSDGKIDEFIDLRDVKDTLKLHPLNGTSYFLGAFLVGAYQETLGDLHNLFGDTNAVHVSLGDDGAYRLDHVVKGDRVDEVLSYVEYDRTELVNRMRQVVEGAVRRGDFSLEQSAAFMRAYEEGLSGYTYLEGLE